MSALHPPAELVAVHAGHHPVADHDVHARALEHLPGLGPVVRDQALVPKPLELALEHQARRRRVVRDQDLHAAPRRTLSRIAHAAATSPRSTWSRIASCRRIARLERAQRLLVGPAGRRAVPAALVRAAELERRQAESGVHVEGPPQRSRRRVGVAQPELGHAAHEVRVGVERVLVQQPFRQGERRVEAALVGRLERRGKRAPRATAARRPQAPPRQDRARAGGAEPGPAERLQPDAPDPDARDGAPSRTAGRPRRAAASAGRQAALERRDHLLDRVAVEVDQDVAAGDQVERRPTPAADRSPGCGA